MNSDIDQLIKATKKLEEIQMKTEKKIKDVAVYRRYNNVLIKLLITLIVSYSLVAMCLFVSCAIIVTKFCKSNNVVREVLTEYERIDTDGN